MPGAASASTTVVEAEAMQWGAQVGQVYSDAGASGGAGFQAWANSWGQASVDLPLAPTGLRVRVRSRQRSLGGLGCSGNPEVAVRIDGTTVLKAAIAPSSSFAQPLVDVRRIAAGVHRLEVGLRNDAPGDPLHPCERQLWIDKLTVVGSRLFSPDSWRNRPLAPDAALDADQSAAQRLAEQERVHGSWVNTREWSAPVYIASANQPRVPVLVEEHEAPELGTDWASVPLVSTAMGAPPADGYDDRDPLLLRLNKREWTDRSLVVYQPATDTLWEFIHFIKRGGAFYAGDGGKISNVSESNGSWDPWPFPNRPHGTTGAGIPHMIGMQTISEVTGKGAIDHVVSLTIPHTTDVDPSHPNPDETGVRPPAIRSDGDRNPALYPDAVEEGTRFRLPADLNLDALGLTPYGLMVARAVQRYGAVVVDRDCALGQACTGPDADSHAAVTFYAEQPPAGQVDPYVARFGAGFPEGALANFPWDRLQVLPPLTP